MLQFDTDRGGTARIKVVGVGGGGNNAVNTMIDSGLANCDFIAANTDAQALGKTLAPVHVQLGTNLTKGLGAGGDPEIGRKAAVEDQSRLMELLEGADMVFITAGMGGGTGTGGAPVIAQAAKDCGALTVGVVTRPFEFEGRRRRRQAEEGISELRQYADTIIVIPNQRLLEVVDATVAMLDAFRLADSVLLEAVQGITDIITLDGFINVDFADVRSTMINKGLALMGSGRGTGERRALDAAQRAIASPLLEDLAIDGATGVLINITGGPDVSLYEVNEAAGLIGETAHEDANIIFGAVVDPDLGDEVKVTVIATGFEGQPVEHSDVRRSERMYRSHDREVPAFVRARRESPAVNSESAPVQHRVPDAPSKPVERRVTTPAPMQTAAPAPPAKVAAPPVATTVTPNTVTTAASPPVNVETPERRVTRELPAFPTVGVVDEDEYDIPTFLRRQVD